MKTGAFSKPIYSEWLAKQKKKASVRAKTPLKLKRGSMTKPIPLKMRNELAEDPFMQECCIRSFECKGRIEFHHALTYAGKRVNEYGAILPVCRFHHEKEAKYRKQLEQIMNTRMSFEAKLKYPKRKWL